MIKSKSSNIEAFEYIGSTLRVKFRHGGTYSYSKVPKELYDQFLKADSHGKFLAENIKNKFDYVKEPKNDLPAL